MIIGASLESVSLNLTFYIPPIFSFSILSSKNYLFTSIHPSFLTSSLAALHIEPMQPFLLNMETNDGTYNLYTRSLAFLSSCPNFFFSKFPLALKQHSLVSFTRWIDLVGTRSDGTGRKYDSVSDVPL